MMRLPLGLLAVLLACAAAACGSGSSGGSDSSAGGGGTLNVFAASSLTEAFTQLATTYQDANPGWKVRLNFLGSDELAAQIEQGVSADVYAAASSKYPEQLQGEDMLGKTTDFATNTLVLITPKDNPAGITSADDLTKGAKLVVGDPSVPIGSYTEQVLGNLRIDPSSLNVVSREDKVKSIATKVELGEADAGFVYTSDANALGDSVNVIQLPASAQATATYPIGIVSDSSNTEAAQRWIDLVMSPQGQEVLTSHGFGAAPSS
jgi:molybdate transport system substrate-binding protein